MVVISVPAPDKKLKAEPTKKALIKIAKGLKQEGIDKILVTHSDLFKFIVKKTKVSNCYGEVTKGELEGYEDIRCLISIDYNALIYNQTLQHKLTNSLEVFKHLCKAKFNLLKKDILHKHVIPISQSDKKLVLNELFEKECLSADVETTGLRFEVHRIVSIGFAWNKHEGASWIIEDGDLELLRIFFESYDGELLFHNALFDCKFLIYHCFMQDSLDIRGLHQGLTAFQNVDDTMLYAFLAQNSIHDIELGLKENSYEFAGNYGIEDLHDASKIDPEELLVYNVKDCCCTHYVKEKYLPTLIADGQLPVYENIFQPSIKVMLYIMLIGMPMNMNTILHLEKKLSGIRKRANKNLSKLSCVAEAYQLLQQMRAKKDNEIRKKKAVNPDKIKIKTAEDMPEQPFNFGSSSQLNVLLYTVLELPVINKTKGGQPSTDAKTLKYLKNHTDDPNVIFIIEQLEDLASVNIILDTFITAFKEYAFEREDGTVWLNGNKKLGGTQSGRGSSNSPNMENIPSNSIYGKDVKEGFEAPDGFLFAGADFASLEDRINAILTGDTNKVKVYTDGFDGHCLRAFSYFGSEMGDIENTLESINSIEEKYPKIRQRSKQPTFALTYLGTASTLVKNLGLSWEEARQIEDSYHELYKESDAWADTKIDFAYKHGYVECAFGLRVRTPLLHKTVRTKKNNMHVAEKEQRSAVNAITQSWGMLINRTAIEVIDKILLSKFKYDIYPINTIHDSIYFLVRNKPEVIKFLNDTLIAAMEWNDDPLIKSDDVPMRASLEIGTNWKNLSSLKNYASIGEINNFLTEKELVHE